MPDTWEMMVGTLRLLVAPTLATSLVLMLVLALLLRWLKAVWLTPLAAVLAVVGGVYVGNEFCNREPMHWQLKSDRPLTVQDLRTVLGWSLEAKPPKLAPPEG